MKFNELYESVMITEKSSLTKLGLSNSAISSFHKDLAYIYWGNRLKNDAKWNKLKDKLELKSNLQHYGAKIILGIDKKSNEYVAIEKRFDESKKLSVYMFNAETNKWEQVGEQVSITDALKRLKKNHVIYKSDDIMNKKEQWERAQRKLPQKFKGEKLGKELVKYKSVIIRELERLISTVDISDPFKDKPQGYSEIQRLIYVLNNDSPEQIANVFEIALGEWAQYDHPREAILQLIDELKNSKDLTDVFKRVSWFDLVNIHQGHRVSRAN